MRPPRRIFRSTGVPRLPLTRPVMLTTAAVFVTAVAVVGMSSDLFGRTTPVPERTSAEPAEVRVVDGGTLRLGTQVIRLRGVEAPPRGELCRSGQDCGGAAASALASLVGEHRVDCRLAGGDDGGRPLATCEAGGRDLGRAMVASGWARSGSGQPDLAALELQARRLGSGLWAGGAD